jgi:hypothetical protein
LPPPSRLSQPDEGLRGVRQQLGNGGARRRELHRRSVLLAYCRCAGWEGRRAPSVVYREAGMSTWAAASKAGTGGQPNRHRPWRAGPPESRLPLATGPGTVQMSLSLLGEICGKSEPAGDPAGL